MKKYRLDLAYDGKDFSGSQIQPGKRTVQGEVLQCLSKICNPDSFTFSGRTDSGVHARQQVASFKSTIDNLGTKAHSLESMTPDDITIKKIKRVPMNFDARYSAKLRVYKYFVKTISNSHPTDRGNHWIIKEDLNLNNLNELSKNFIGNNDYTNFAKKDPTRKTDLIISDAKWIKRNSTYIFTIEGRAFLWQMVRNIVGSLIAVNSGLLTEEDLLKRLNDTSLSRVNHLAPPEGLYLWRVKY